MYVLSSKSSYKVNKLTRLLDLCKSLLNLALN
jgi:hypothetical protein